MVHIVLSSELVWLRLPIGSGRERAAPCSQCPPCRGRPTSEV